MNKSVKKRLADLREALGRHEEAAEKHFSAKTVAIVKYRVGAEDGAVHEMEDTAKHFNVSTTWVGKATKQISDFCAELDKKVTKKAVKKTARKVPVQSEEKESGVRIAIMSAKIENGKVTVKHADPKVAAMVQEDLQKMLDEAKPCGECEACVGNKTKMEIAEEARRLNNKAGSRGAWAFIALISALLLGLVVTAKSGELTSMQVAVGYGLVALISFAGLVSYISGVSYLGKRNGLLEGLRRL